MTRVFIIYNVDEDIADSAQLSLSYHVLLYGKLSTLPVIFFVERRVCKNSCYLFKRRIFNCLDESFWWKHHLYCKCDSHNCSLFGSLGQSFYWQQFQFISYHLVNWKCFGSKGMLNIMLKFVNIFSLNIYIIFIEGGLCVLCKNIIKDRRRKKIKINRWPQKFRWKYFSLIKQTVCEIM